MAKRKITPFAPWETKTSDGIEKRYFRLGNSLLYAPAFLQLSPNAKQVYLYMRIESSGKKEFIMPRSKQTKFTSKDSFLRAKEELEAAGFIDTVQNNSNIRKPNIYCFSERWKER
jgi:hypothetical protein